MDQNGPKKWPIGPLFGVNHRCIPGHVSIYQKNNQIPPKNKSPKRITRKYQKIKKNTRKTCTIHPTKLPIRTHSLKKKNARSCRRVFLPKSRWGYRRLAAMRVSFALVLTGLTLLLPGPLFRCFGWLNNLYPFLCLIPKCHLGVTSVHDGMYSEGLPSIWSPRHADMSRWTTTTCVCSKTCVGLHAPAGEYDGSPPINKLSAWEGMSLVVFVYSVA